MLAGQKISQNKSKCFLTNLDINFLLENVSDLYFQEF